MLEYLCFKATRSYNTPRRTHRIICLSLSVAKVANDRVGVFPQNVQSPFIWANQRVPSFTTSVCVLHTVQSSCSNSPEPQVLICYFDLIASQSLVCEFHHAYRWRPSLICQGLELNECIPVFNNSSKY